MDNLKRYDQDRYGNIRSFHNGRLVRYKDVADLEAEIESYKRTVAALTHDYYFEKDRADKLEKRLSRPD